jgi:hypothetical protein
VASTTTMSARLHKPIDVPPYRWKARGRFAGAIKSPLL